MNIFVTDVSPSKSAQVLPDKHVVKMPLETCQMVSIIYSKWYYDWGTINKADGTPYNTVKGAFRNHPCTKWVADNHYNLAWLITHGIHLCFEYEKRYQKRHSCLNTMEEAMVIFHNNAKISISKHTDVKEFTRAMPDEYKLDESIDTFTAYKMYIASKPWVADNYLRMPSRKPDWI
jgi:hypothetical protein